ncbi:MAG TPA: CDP-diacylglycerol--glycerol-3-phosphate 3-phosphatidyltransferase [Nitrospiraceae bacterium]|jgi:CDP-diacylglycerol--glycerol-3-phosphate 3-phosphatidyltransferase|nr:CDP-diacylglycerol--glycerol-3-phosphate 3-phosphatidyltransferase [Nitrospiraceae bacterium]
MGQMAHMPFTEAKQTDTLVAKLDGREANVNLPNLLTFSRLLLIPIFVLLFSQPTPERSVAAATVFGIAAITDLLDGYLARRRSEVTRLGRLLDPIADKLLVISGLILLVEFQRVSAIVAILMIAREVAVTGIRAISAAEGIVLSAETIGKYKMTAQVLAILFLIVADSVDPEWKFYAIGNVLLYSALMLGLISGAKYLITFWRQISLKGL